MKLFNTYQSLLKSTIYLLLISQFTVYTALYYQLLVEDYSELTEIYGLVDFQTEGEIDEKKEDAKLSKDSSNSIMIVSTSHLNILHSEYFHYTHKLDIITPPPKNYIA